MALAAVGLYLVKKHHDAQQPAPTSTSTPPVTTDPVVVVTPEPTPPAPTTDPVVYVAPDPVVTPPAPTPVIEPTPDPVAIQPPPDPVVIQPDPAPVITEPKPPITVSPYGVEAASPELADVRAAIDRAEEGSTVHVPLGQAEWTDTLTITKYVRLISEGVQIVNSVQVGNLFNLYESPLGSSVLAGFQCLTGGFNPTGDWWPAFVSMILTANGRPLVVRDCSFPDMRSFNTFRALTNRGLITRCKAQASIYKPLYGNNASFLRHKPGDYAPDSWTTPSVMGAEDVNGDRNLYVEDCSLAMFNEGFDCDDNGRTVIRDSTLVNTPVLTHGNDTSGTGGRSIEAYRLNFVYDTSIGGLDGPQNFQSFATLRGGTMVLWGCTIPLIDSGGWWGPKFPLVFYCENLRRNAGPYACYAGPYPVPHQVGRGMNDTPEPVYRWANTGAGVNRLAIGDYEPNECGAGARSAAEFILIGRDVMPEGVPRPGYAPYRFPHPLTEA